MADTRKQRTPNFEEMAHDYDWPESLRALHDAARAAWTAYAELDAIHTAISVPEMDTNQHERGPLYTLASQAWDLYQAVCAEGMRQLAELERIHNEQWEAEQAKRAVFHTICACGTDVDRCSVDGYVSCPTCGELHTSIPPF